MFDSNIIARCKIESMAPYCQSRQHSEPDLEGESKDAKDIRTWRLKMHTQIAPGNKQPTVHIPARAIHDALAEAAKYSKIQIPNQGKATWTKKFEAGIAFLSDIDLGIDPQTVDYVTVSCNPQGIRGGRGRVPRRFPIIPKWKAIFDVNILDPIITKEIFTEILGQAGLYIGIGQNRPQNRGTHGRFMVISVEWIGEVAPDQRKLRAA